MSVFISGLLLHVQSREDVCMFYSLYMLLLNYALAILNHYKPLCVSNHWMIDSAVKISGHPCQQTGSHVVSITADMALELKFFRKFINYYSRKSGTPCGEPLYPGVVALERGCMCSYKWWVKHE